MKTSPHVAIALALSLVLAGGCKDKKKPLLEAKAEHGRTLATLAAHVPLLDPKAGSTAVAYVARKRIVAAVSGAAAAENVKRSTLDEQMAQPRLMLQSSFQHVHAMCGTFATEDAASLAKCAEAVHGLDRDLEMIHGYAEKAGLGADFPATLAGWNDDEARKKSDALVKLASGGDDKLDRLWNDEKATFAALDAECKSRREKSQAAAPAAATDDDVAQIVKDAEIRSITRCAHLIQYSLADKVLGACLDKNDGACFHERSCIVVRGLKDTLEPKISVLDSPEAALSKLDGVPRALAPRAKQLVDRCSPYLH